MRIINVIEQHGGLVDNIVSFPIYEEQLSDEVVASAEKLFLESAKAIGWDEEDDFCPPENDLLDDGYFENRNYDSVSLAWSRTYDDGD